MCRAYFAGAQGAPDSRRRGAARRRWRPGGLASDAARDARRAVDRARFPRGQWIRIWASAGGATQTKFVRTSVAGTFTVAFTFRVVPCRMVAFVAARRVGSPTILAQLKVSPAACG